MKALCDVGVCGIVEKLYKRPFYIIAYKFHQNLHTACANAGFCTIL
jgi:hypothetical protein